MKIIILSKGYNSHVDDDDFDRVNQFKWTAKRDKNKVYAIRKEKTTETGYRKTIYLHRFIMGIDDPAIQVDHRDGDGLMNTKGNLRLCSNQQNSMNRKPYTGTASGYKGVRPSSKSSWVAIVIKNKEQHYLGVFPTSEAAARAYDKKAKELFGEFANLNFPGE